MTNVFLLDYYTRLRNWHKLREDLKNSDTKTICVEVDKFWQQAPLSNHYLHPDFIKDWPDPWQLLNDNTYCDYGRALGMVYTLILLGTENIELVAAKDDNNNDVVLVLVDNCYVLNYWPDTVLDNKISDFTIIKYISIESLKSKIR